MLQGFCAIWWMDKLAVCECTADLIKILFSFLLFAKERFVIIITVEVINLINWEREVRVEDVGHVGYINIGTDVYSMCDNFDGNIWQIYANGSSIYNALRYKWFRLTSNWSRERDKLTIIAPKLLLIHIESMGFFIHLFHEILSESD